MSKDQFELVSPFQPTGDQPEAIDALVKSIEAGNRMQTLKGVTGSGKTFTMANIIQRINPPRWFWRIIKHCLPSCAANSRSFSRRTLWNTL